MQYLILTFSVFAAFVGGYFTNTSPPCPEQEKCDKNIIEKVYDQAIKNCQSVTDWEDYECFRYMNTGRAPSTPTPRPTITPAPSFKYKFNYDKFKSKDDDAESESE